MKRSMIILSLALAASAHAAVEPPSEPVAVASPAPVAAPAPKREPRTAGLALVGARVVTMAGKTYNPGTVLIEKDTIVAVGGSELDVPSRYNVVDVKGLEIYPGFIDTNTRLGLVEVDLESATHDVDEHSDPVTPHIKVEDGLNVRSELIPVTRLNGITTVLSTPGEGNLFSGQSAVIDLAGETVAEMVVKSPAFLHMNLGEEPRDRGRSKGKFMTRMGLLSEARETWLKAQEYKRKLERHKEELAIFEEEQKEEDAKAAAEEAKAKEPAKDASKDAKDASKDVEAKDKKDAAKDEKPAEAKAEAPKKKKKKLSPEPPSRDLKMEALVAALKGEIPVFIRAHREDDIRNALALSKEYGFKAVLSHVTEGWRVAPMIVDSGVFASVGPINVQPESWETLGAKYENAALLAKAGVPIAIQTGDAHNVRNLPFYAGLAAAHGLGRDEALSAITIDAARLLGIDKRYGSIEKGKVANLIVVDGDPLQPSSRVRRLFIRGKELPLKSKQTQLFEKYRK